MNNMISTERWFEKFHLRQYPAFAIILIIIISIAVYSNSLFNGFVYDDIGQVAGNMWIRDIKNIPAIFTSDVWSFLPDLGGTNYYRPMTHIIYMANYHVFGLQPWGFHLVNILFHAGASVLVFLILLKLHKEYRPEAGASFIFPSLSAAVLFAAHPIHTEAVAWVAGLPDLSFSFFFLLSFCFYIRAEGGLNGDYFLSLVSFCFAALCKEPALLLPAALIAHDHLSGRTGRNLAGLLKRYIPYLLIIIIYFILRHNALGGFSPINPHVRLSAYGNIINIFPLFLQYLTKLILPLNLNVFHVFHPIPSILEANGIISLGAAAAFILTALIFFKKNRLLFFSFFLIALPLLPSLYIPALGENVFAERYLYLPSFGFVMLISVLLALWDHGWRGRGSKFALLAVIILTLLYSIGTISRNAVWKDNVTLFTDAARKSPEAGLPHGYLGSAFLEKGLVDEAIKEYIISLSLDPDSVEIHNNLGNAYDYKGLTDKAIEHYLISLSLNPGVAATNYNLGIVLGKKGLLDYAIQYFNIALKIDPNNADIYYNLGVTLEQKGMFSEADKYFKIAQRLRE